MKHIKSGKLLASGVILAAIAGCESTGLSPREAGSRNVSSYVMSLYDAPPGAFAQEAEAVEPARLVLPARVAVVQVGEVAPPSSMLRKLEEKQALFARVEALPGVFPIGAAASSRNYNYDDPSAGAMADERRVREEMQKMRRVALDMGMDHLLLIGGTIDHGTETTGLSAADLTIIGAFVMPSRSIKAEARATAALIDLRTNRLVLTASADARQSAMASAAGQGDKRINVLRKTRDAVLNNVIDDLIAQCEQRLAAGAAPGLRG